MTDPETYHHRLRISTIETAKARNHFARDVQAGLSAPQKTLPAKYFYDDRGSQLYEQICALPEYYPYRAERQILKTYAADIYTEIADLTLVELGAGNAAKTRYLLAQHERRGRPYWYCPVDISRAALLASADHLLPAFPHLSMHALHTDFSMHPRALETLRLGKKAVAFLGSSLGNFTAEESVGFLRQTAAVMGPEDAFLLGIDLKKSTEILLPAYNDAKGVTAAFNLNILRRINRELGGTFDLQKFDHLALYNEAHGRIEMHLRSRSAHQVRIAEIDLVVAFAAGETIHTENSYKYAGHEIRELARRANLELHRTWFDTNRYFMLGLFRLAA